MLEKFRHLAAATERGAFLFRPRGPQREWEMVGYGLYGQNVTGLAILGESGVAASVKGGNVKYSRDWVNWRTLYSGLDYPDVYSVAAHPDGALLAGTEPAAVFRSGGVEEPWRPLGETTSLAIENEWSHPDPPHSPRIIRLLVHARRSNSLIAGIQSGGVLISRDGGRSWHNQKAGLSKHLTDLRLSPDHPDRLYATNFLGFYRSDDLGRSWRRLNRGLPYEEAEALCVHNLGPDRLLLAVRNPEDDASVLFKSDDGGEHWQVACAELPSDEGLRVTCLESGGGVYFAGTREGFLFGSRDREHWEIVRAGLPPINTLTWVGEYRLPMGDIDG
ncbi:MAG: hypothetical protein WC314_11335 [Vulcanimicrobiota bacterium]